MIVTTTPDIEGQRVIQTLGLVRGNTIRARFIGRDILAVLRSVAGGEIGEYTKMMAEAREQAIDRMIDEAQSLGADAVVAVRFQTSVIMKGASEILCYGTAVRVADRDSGPATER